MTKYRVVLPNSSVEFPSDHQQQANDFATANNTTVQTITYDDTPPLPDMEVAMWKLRVVLTSMGLIGNINTLLAALPDPQKTAATIAWNEASTVQCNGATVRYLQQGLGLSDAQVLQIFNTANTIDV